MQMVIEEDPTLADNMKLQIGDLVVHGYGRDATARHKIVKLGPKFSIHHLEYLLENVGSGEQKWVKRRLVALAQQDKRVTFDVG